MELWGHYRPPEFSWHPQYVICMPRDFCRSSINWPLFCVRTDDMRWSSLKQPTWGWESSVCMFSSHNECKYKIQTGCMGYDVSPARRAAGGVHTSTQVCAQMALGTMWANGNCTLASGRQLKKACCSSSVICGNVWSPKTLWFMPRGSDMKLTSNFKGRRFHSFHPISTCSTVVKLCADAAELHEYAHKIKMFSNRRMIVINTIKLYIYANTRAYLLFKGNQRSFCS